MRNVFSQSMSEKNEVKVSTTKSRLNVNVRATSNTVRI